MKSMLVAVDLSEVTELVIETAGELARALSAQIRLIHVAAPEPDFVGYEPDSEVMRDTIASEYREEHRRLQKLADDLRARNVEVKALLVRGVTVEKILEEAERAEADLVVLGSHGHGAVHRVLLGSTSEGVLRRAQRPLLIVPTRSPD